MYHVLKTFSFKALEQAHPGPLPLLQTACNLGHAELARLLIEQQAHLHMQEVGESQEEAAPCLHDL